MSTRLAKQLVYGTLYIVLWGGVIWLGYHWFTAAPASCFDGVHNQGEQGIDCGGPCARVCAAGLQAIKIDWVRAFAARGGNDSFLARVENVNQDSAAQSFGYSFNLSDSSGNLIQSFPGQSFLYGGEVKYLLLVNQQVASSAAVAIADSNSVIVNANLAIPTSTTAWVAASAFGPKPQLAVQNVATQVGSTTVMATGQVVDNDTAAFNNIFIVAIFKDANGNPLGASQTLLDHIAPNQTQNFSASYPVPPGVNPAATEVAEYAIRE